MFNRVSISLQKLKIALKRCFLGEPDNHEGEEVDIEQSSTKAQVERLTPDMVGEIFELVKEAPEQQINSASSLDSKIVQVFGAASVVMGFLGLSSSNDLVGGYWWMLVLLIGALAAYMFTAVVTFRHLEPKEFWRNLEVSRWLSPTYQNLDEDGFRRLAIVDTGRAYTHNNKIIEAKSRYMRCALVSTAVEVFLVAVVLILYRLI